VPIGLGSGACAAIAARQALGHRVRIVGVVSAHATTYADSLAAGRVVPAPVTTRLPSPLVQLPQLLPSLSTLLLLVLELTSR
jgi:hypothetical protein